MPDAASLGLDPTDEFWDRLLFKALALLLLAACLTGLRRPESLNLLVNGGFEANGGPGTIPDGWMVLDENLEYFGWIAPRTAKEIGGIGPRSGRYMVGCDTDSMGVDTNGEEDRTPRSAIYQTLAVPGGTRGTFSLFYNDRGSSALGHVSAIRLAYTVNSTEIGVIRVVSVKGNGDSGATPGPGIWSDPFYRVSQKLPWNPKAQGDWTLASILVKVAEGPAARLTLWIGIFENQNSTELGYWRIDDGSFRIEGPEPSGK